MSVLTGTGLTVQFLGKPVFQDAGFQVNRGDRVGLIGPNGAGKTTLLRVIVGEITPDRGEVVLAKGARLAYLPQNLEERLQGSIRQTVRAAAPGREEVRRELAEVEHRFGEATEDAELERLGTRLGELHGRLSDLETRFPDHEADRILQGLGFAIGELDRPVSELSGGWRMRAALAGLLFSKPDFLLLDEPTNHLDLPSIHWLESFLQGFPGAIVMISHDRDFLNRHVSRILSLEPEGLRSYTGDFEAYVQMREEERGFLEARAKKQEKRVKDAQRFIDRFKAKASKARQAQSKIKLIEKIEMVETHQERRVLRFSFPPVDRSGQLVLQVRKLSKAYGERRLFKDLDLGVTRGERVALLGPVGAGKTTLLKIIAGEVFADQGEAGLGHGVSMSYYAQHQSEALDPTKTIVEEVARSVPGSSLGFVRGACGAFLFSGDDVEKPISVLSGGEKARVALAKLLVRPANFLCMDEPTNHLDLTSTEALVEALQEYQGTLLFVSHNQAFVRRLATRIWDLHDGVLEDYPGTLAEYYDHLDRRAAAIEGGKGAPPGPAQKGQAGARPPTPLRSAPPPPRPQADRRPEPVDALPAGDRKEARRQRAEDRVKRQQVLGPIEKRVKDFETRISELETQEAELATRLADPSLFQDKEKSVPLLREHGEVRSRLEQLMARWEAAQEELDAARSRLEAEGA